jgi:hypothetical protein
VQLTLLSTETAVVPVFAFDGTVTAAAWAGIPAVSLTTIDFSAPPLSSSPTATHEVEDQQAVLTMLVSSPEAWGVTIADDWSAAGHCELSA